MGETAFFIVIFWSIDKRNASLSGAHSAWQVRYLIYYTKCFVDVFLNLLAARISFMFKTIIDYSGLFRATCPDFESHHSGELEPLNPEFESHPYYYSTVLWTGASRWHVRHRTGGSHHSGHAALLHRNNHYYNVGKRRHSNVHIICSLQ